MCLCATYVALEIGLVEVVGVQIHGLHMQGLNAAGAYVNDAILILKPASDAQELGSRDGDTI